jgi:class 3 adenylate cyclase/tetratricopeptide (TPR) repeat protein
VLICPNCGEENPARARFCWNCGTPLKRPEGVEERKIVTVLFADLVGFTARSDRADPEDVKATLRPYHALLKQEIERTGGTLDKFIGDGVMGVFGAPATHEDDAERAIRSALRIQEAIDELNAATGIGLSARIGVATGEAVVAFGAGPQLGESVTGDVVNTASRVQSVAPAGGVVADESTYRATRELFDYEPLGQATVKGKAEPLSIWQPVAPKSRLGVGISLLERTRTPFIDRVEELALIKATFRRVAREGSVQLITVAGEPGVGKSRLIEEFRSYLDDLPDVSARWRQGRCLPYGEGITFWAFAEIVKSIAGILEGDPPAETERKLASTVERLVDEETERDWIRARLAPLTGIGDASASADRAESFAAWRRFLDAVADPYPLVLVFEDLHWADGPMLEFIDHLVDWPTGVPVLILCGARPELYDRHSRWGGGKRNSVTLPLYPLSDQEMSLLISALLDRTVLPADTQATLLERSTGNPLYAEEFIRMLTDQGILQREGATVGLVRDVDITVPETVQGMVAARLDGLPLSQKGLLHDASVIGKVFWSGALAAMGGIDQDQAERDLHELAKKELVRPSRTSSVAGQNEFSFWHVLIRDVAYGQIPRAKRGAKHRAAAEWIERVTGDRVADVAEVVAHHYVEALELTRSAGEQEPSERAELEAAAARYLAMAGDRAVRLDLAKAHGYYGRALELLPPNHRDRPSVLLSAARTGLMAGRFVDAERMASEALESYRTLGDRVGQGKALAQLATIVNKMGDVARPVSLLEEAVAILESEPPGPELAEAYARAANVHLLIGRYSQSLEWSEKALLLTEQLGLVSEAVRARQSRGAARCDLGDPGGLDDLREALRQALELGLGEETALCYGNLAYQLWGIKGPAAALDVWRECEEFSWVRGFESMRITAKAGILEVQSDLGGWDEVLQVASEIDEWDRARGGTEIGALALVYRTLALLRRGEIRRASEVEHGLVAAQKLERVEFLAPVLVVGALLRERLGDPQEALALIARFREVTEGHWGYRANHLPETVRVSIAQGNVELARTLLVDEEPVKTTRGRHSLLTARALLAEATGDVGHALSMYQEAARRWDEYGFALERGRSLLGAARCRLAQGEDGSSLLEVAREVFAALGARPLLAEVDAWLSQAEALQA